MDGLAWPSVGTVTEIHDYLHLLFARSGTPLKLACYADPGAWRQRFQLQALFMTDSAPAQPRNPLHGKALEAIVTELEAFYGWAGLAERVPVRCFTLDPSVKSSLKFLRKTPWAREKVERLYLFMLREIRRNN